ncbi:MAG: metallophosphoesterase [Nitrososphaerota archaeon]|nr:metallophosphoesterase [Aigarchaeota archaeon]MDW8077141.1 metallophosphoesterase [Nitrososphaerota archaeon]
MLIGIISDTHDNLDRIKRAVQIFKERNVGLVIHCGDWVAPFSVREFKGLRVISVLGNNDGDLLLLEKTLRDMGSSLEGRFASLSLSGKKVAVIHGEYPELVEALVRSGMYDVVIHGHTHKRRCERFNGTLILNPGWDSIIVYEDSTDTAEFIET